MPERHNRCAPQQRSAQGAFDVGLMACPAVCRPAEEIMERSAAHVQERAGGSLFQWGLRCENVRGQAGPPVAGGTSPLIDYHVHDRSPPSLIASG
jgi:hypothetical protein